MNKMFKKEFFWITLLSLIYLIGLIGLITPAFRLTFARLTPLTILLSFVILMAFQKEFNLRTILIFLFIALGGYFIEVAGVKTGLIFGQYQYGKSLGLKVMDTPVIIGINWLMLSICAYSLSGLFNIRTIYRVILSSFFMLVYDIILEPVAIASDMWKWSGNHVPIQNYLAWFLISFIFIGMLNIFRINLNNSMGKPVFIIQFCFFIILLLFI